ncbi:AmmeMemoRadiSam system protein A [Amphritea sp. HPY]|uniref:AmmeMemoRadiSam system protein A n=1 Tax=Amphritea sp. HPY TaxID=3421652 RepID=UPI003D7E91E3
MPLMLSAKNGVCTEGEQYTKAEQEYLLALVRSVIKVGLDRQQPVGGEIVSCEYPSLQRQRACFVTLKIDGQLRGCVGNLQADSRLVDAVSRNAYLAAFRDQRFNPVSRDESEQLEVEISVLTPMRELSVLNNTELLQKLRPGVDGLVFEAGDNRATFLPAVWEQLPDPKSFVERLKQKAGLSLDYWSDAVQCQVYQAIKITQDTPND